jgi:hypothetical protein
LYLHWGGQICPQDKVIALDWSIGLHAICVRVEQDIKTAAPQKGYLLEFTAFIEPNQEMT